MWADTDGFCENNFYNGYKEINGTEYIRPKERMGRKYPENVRRKDSKKYQFQVVCSVQQLTVNQQKELTAQ